MSVKASKAQIPLRWLESRRNGIWA